VTDENTEQGGTDAETPEPSPDAALPDAALPAPRRLPRRLLAAGAAAAIATAGVAAGWAAHGLSAGSDPAQTSSRSRPAPWSGGPSGQRPGQWPSEGSGSLDVSRASSSQVTGLVRIVAESAYDGSTAAGTGMVLTPSGEVVTNNHVVEGSTRIRATEASTGKTYTARLLATDRRDDVAALQLRGASGLTPVATDTSGVQRGDSVTAVGDAEGNNSLSAAPGTVSAVRRSITTTDSDGTDGERLHGLIEVDADVLSGDSGGALLDSDGQVVGMTTAASRGSATITGYAIPVAKVLRIVDQANGAPGSAAVGLGYDGFLGVELSTRSAATVGAVIGGTPAARSGITAGSTVTSFAGHRVSTAGQLHRLVAARQPGDVVRVGWRDSSGSHSASVRLVRAPAA
jgi:S1-C subfamily serine protease